MNLEFSKGPTFSGLRLGMSCISSETAATAEAWLLAMSTSMFITLSMLFRYPAGTVWKAQTTGVGSTICWMTSAADFPRYWCFSSPDRDL